MELLEVGVTLVGDCLVLEVHRVQAHVEDEVVLHPHVLEDIHRHEQCRIVDERTDTEFVHGGDGEADLLGQLIDVVLGDIEETEDLRGIAFLDGKQFLHVIFYLRIEHTERN